MTNIPRAREFIERALKIVTEEATMARHGKGVEPDRLQAAADYLETCLPLMTRLILKDPAPPRRGPLTVEEKIEIRDYVARHPEVCFDDIAKKYNCAGGRISEALREI